MTDTPILTAAQALEAEFRGSEDAPLSAFGHLRLASADASHFLHMDSDDADAILDWCERALAARIPPLDGEVAGVIFQNGLRQNPSGMFCKACRAAGAYHCAHPEECDGMVMCPDTEVGALIEAQARELAAAREQIRMSSFMGEGYIYVEQRAQKAEAEAAALRAQLAGAREAATIDGIPWEDTADWSGLPTVFVTKVQKAQGMFWRGEFCSVPMAIGPEVALIPTAPLASSFVDDGIGGEAGDKLAGAREDGLTGIWPDFIAPSKYEAPDPRWIDPGLPDFRLIWKIARDAGYSVGLHGSMKRDCDLIAAPWTNEAVTAEELIKRLCEGLDADELPPVDHVKPHGRRAWVLQIRDAYKKALDISVMPLIPAPQPVDAPPLAAKPVDDRIGADTGDKAARVPLSGIWSSSENADHRADPRDALLDQMAEALRASRARADAAHESMFMQCSSNPVFNQLGKEVNMTAINKLQDGKSEDRAALAAYEKLEGRG